LTGTTPAGNQMPKLKRSDSEERATDFVESLDRGLQPAAEVRHPPAVR